MAKTPRSLTGQVVAITGGARGIGRATAEALIRQGTKVAIGDVDLAEAQRTADALGAGTVALELDVTDRASFAAFLDDAETRLGPVDVLVNNAGIMQVGRFDEEDDATAIRQVDINVHGVITGTKLAIAKMAPRRRGHVVNIASVAGLAPGPGVATYVGTKHFVVGLTESVRLEMRGSGIEFTTICPAPVATELFSGIDTSGVLKPIQPQEVADAIVAALQQPKPISVVPPSVGRLIKTFGLLPPAVNERISKLLKTDDAMLKGLDPAKRAAYEERAAQSEPGLEVPEDQRQTTAA
jgi:NADP-dependent 3-hydroxy acid dehydrogenase YdfG